MKPALFYSIARAPYGGGWYVVAVTTTLEPPPGCATSFQGSWWGRRTDGGGATHGKIEHLRGRFNLIGQADALLETITVIERERRAQHQRLEKERSTIDHAFDQRIAALIKEVTPEGADA